MKTTYKIAIAIYNEDEKSSETYSLYENLYSDNEEKAHELAYVLSMCPKYPKVTVSTVVKTQTTQRIGEYRNGRQV